MAASAMDQITAFLDTIYFTLISPLFATLGRVLTILLINPLTALHLPPVLHVSILALILAIFSFWMRGILRIEQKTRRFNENFAAKREQQQDLQLIADKHSRSALYRVTDEELNDEYNRFLAGHYARYVSIYLLPLFLMLAWLNTIFTANFLNQYHNSPYVLAFQVQSMGIGGFNVTFCFLVAYITWLIAGFQCKRVWGKKGARVESI